jgi:TetR/AcrR family transcriptional regulator, transcriptional repressor for nem operon
MSKPAAHASVPARPRGRPREFDMDKALDQAIRVFSEQGYHATSIGDLIDAMGLASGSIYKAFRDKRAVFLAAFDRYKSLRNQQVDQAARSAKTGRERLREVLAHYADFSRGAEGRRGCLVVGCAVELASVDREMAARVHGSLARNEAFLADLIRQGQADKSIPARIDADQTARVLVCLTQGMRVVGKAGRPPPETPLTIDIAMKLID